MPAPKSQEDWFLASVAADIKEIKTDIKNLKDDRILEMDKEITRLMVKTGRLEWFVYTALGAIIGESALLIIKWPT